MTRTSLRWLVKPRKRRDSLRQSERRRFAFETLEDRRMLALETVPIIPGMQLVDPNLDNLQGQIIYLDFDGEENVVYGGPVSVGPFGVPPFDALGHDGADDAPLVAERIATIVRDVLSPLGVLVTSVRPALTEFSTIYIGGTDAPFSAYGDYVGISETIDTGNQDHQGKGFVFSTDIAAASHSIQEAIGSVADVAVHEAGHLLGFEHEMGPDRTQRDANAGGLGGILDDHAYKQSVDGAVHQWIAKEAYDLYAVQFGLGVTSYGELGDYLVGSNLAPTANWDLIAEASHAYDQDNNVLEGTVDEDVSLLLDGRYDNPLDQWEPYLRHFVAGGDDVTEIATGYSVLGMPYESAYEQALRYWDDPGGLVWLYRSGFKDTAYWYLGHVAHLIADMAVPAHVHKEGHRGWLFGDDEQYEEWVAKDGHFRAYEASSGWSIELPAHLQSLFLLTANYTEDYDSDGADGDANSGSGADYVAGARAPGRHRPQDVQNDWYGIPTDLDDAECAIVARDLMPWAIEQTASLFRLFYSQVDDSRPEVADVRVNSAGTPQAISVIASDPTSIGTSSFAVTGVAQDPESGVSRNLVVETRRVNSGGQWDRHAVTPQWSGGSFQFNLSLAPRTD